MSLLTIVEASKQFNIARSHLYKKIKEGEISTQLNESGTKVIQYVDLVRVFGESNAVLSKTIEDSPQSALKDNRGQPLSTGEDKYKTSPFLLIASVFIIILLIGIITILSLKFSDMI